jgi:hypothetical protein
MAPPALRLLEEQAHALCALARVQLAVSSLQSEGLSVLGPGRDHLQKYEDLFQEVVSLGPSHAD